MRRDPHNCVRPYLLTEMAKMRRVGIQGLLYRYSIRIASSQTPGKDEMSNNSEDAITKPTLETILDRINALQGQINGLIINFTSFRDDFRLFRDELENRLDRIDSSASRTRAPQ